MADDQAKIFIDEDWKEKVRREKEEASKKAVETPAAAEADAQDLGEGQGMPEPTFTTLMSTLSMQAMLALGVIAPRETEQVMIDLDQAKFTIDLLIMLREKTKGNLSAEEEGELVASLADLQRVYVARVQQYQDHLMRNAGVDPANLRPGQ